MRADGRIAGAQERVGDFLECQHGRNGWLACRTKVTNSHYAPHQCLIVRIDRKRKISIGRRVFMAAINDSFIIKDHQFTQAGPHGGGIAFEQTPASHGKQRIAGKQQLP